MVGRLCASRAKGKGLNAEGRAAKCGERGVGRWVGVSGGGSERSGVMETGVEVIGRRDLGAGARGRAKM